MKRLFFICMIIAQSITAICQANKLPDIEKLKQELKGLKGVKYVDKANQISWTYGIMGRPKFIERADSILKYASLAFDAASKIGYKKGVAQAYLNKASSTKIRSVGLRLANADETTAIEQGIDFLIPALNLGKELKNNEIIADAIWQLQDEFFIKLNLRNKSSLEQVKKENSIEPALLYQKAGAEKKLAEAYTYMGQGNTFSGDYEKAFDYTLKAVDLNQKVLSQTRTKEEHGYRIYLIQQSLSDLANLYEEAGDYHTSLEYLNRSAEFGRKYKTGWLLEREKAEIFSLLEEFDSVAIYTNKLRSKSSDNAWDNLSLGNSFLAKNKMDSALYFLLKTYKAFRDINQMAHFTIPVSLKIAQAYLGKVELKEAKQYATDAMMLAVNNNSRPDQVKGYELLSKIHYQQGNSDSAYLNLLQHITLKDSIQNRQFLMRIYSAKKESQIGYLQRDNKIKEARLKQESQLSTFFLIGIFVLLIFGLFLSRWLSLKRKNERLVNEKIKGEFQQKAIELEMQALRAQMNPHFIFNCLSSINRFIYLNDNQTASDYLTRFSRLIRMVLIYSQKNVIPLEDELEVLRLYLDMERLRFKNGFDYSITTNNSIDAGAIFIPPLILQPFCENAIWHGLMHKDKKGHLRISIAEENGVLYCTISDDGVGREQAALLKSKSVEKHKSLGLKITSARLDLFNKQHNEGTSYKIEDIIENGVITGTKVHLKINLRPIVEKNEYA